MMLEATVRVPRAHSIGKASTIVHVENVVKRFGDVTALAGVSLDVPEGAFFSLLGPSGCGKTTLLMILAGLERPTSGEVVLDGDTITKVPPERRPFNLVFQNYALFPHLSVAQNIAFGPRRQRSKRGGDLDGEIAEMLQLVDLEGYEDRMPSELSGGQSQRVALARALINRPRMLLLDEPMAALDRNVRMAVRERLLRIHAELGTTFLLVTHDQEEALSMSSAVALMDHGRIVQLDDPEELYKRPKSLFAATFLGSGSLLDVHVGEVRNGRAVIELGGRTINPWRADARPDQRGVLLLRPQELHLTSRDEGILTGRVVTATFLGESTEYAITTEMGEVRARSDRSVHRDDVVGLAWEADAGVALAPADS